MKCIRPWKHCFFRDEKGYCHWDPDTAKCPSECPWLERIFFGEEEVLGNCMATCIYEVWEKCPYRKQWADSICVAGGSWHWGIYGEPGECSICGKKSNEIFSIHITDPKRHAYAELFLCPECREKLLGDLIREAEKRIQQYLEEKKKAKVVKA